MKLEETMIKLWEVKEQESNCKYKESKVHCKGSFLYVTHSAPEPTGLSWLTCFELWTLHTQRWRCQQKTAAVQRKPSEIMALRVQPCRCRIVSEGPFFSPQFLCSQSSWVLSLLCCLLATGKKKIEKVYIRSPSNNPLYVGVLSVVEMQNTFVV